MYCFIVASLNKPATQSVSTTDRWSERNPAGNAVDGNADPYLSHDSCAHPHYVDGSVWWMVDLEDSYDVTSLTIVQRSNPLYIGTITLSTVAKHILVCIVYIGKNNICNL